MSSCGQGPLVEKEDHMKLIDYYHFRFLNNLESHLFGEYDRHSLCVPSFSMFSFFIVFRQRADAAPSECQIWSTFVITPRIMLTEETVAHIQIYDWWRIRLICCFFLFYTTMQIQLHCIEAQFSSYSDLHYVTVNCVHLMFKKYN